jgi:hypothetical protein
MLIALMLVLALVLGFRLGVTFAVRRTIDRARLDVAVGRQAGGGGLPGRHEAWNIPELRDADRR